MKELRSAKRMQQWWRRQSNELVNSNIPTIPLIKSPDEGMGCDVAQEAEAAVH
jgi:hypothetical protein